MVIALIIMYLKDHTEAVAYINNRQIEWLVKGLEGVEMFSGKSNCL